MNSFDRFIGNPHAFIKGYVIGLSIGAISMFMFGLLFLKNI